MPAEITLPCKNKCGKNMRNFSEYCSEECKQNDWNKK